MVHKEVLQEGLVVLVLDQTQLTLDWSRADPDQFTATDVDTVDSRVVAHVGCLSVPLVADSALVRLLLLVEQHVLSKDTHPLPADGTDLLVALVRNVHVALQHTRLRLLEATHAAGQAALQVLTEQVVQQFQTVLKGLLTEIASDLKRRDKLNDINGNNTFKELTLPSTVTCSSNT